MDDLFYLQKKSLDILIENILLENLSPESAAFLIKEQLEDFIEKNQTFFRDKHFDDDKIRNSVYRKIDETANSFYILYEQILDDTKIDLKKKYDKIYMLYIEAFISPVKIAVNNSFHEAEALLSADF